MPSAMAPASASTSWSRDANLAESPSIKLYIQVTTGNFRNQHRNQQQNDRRFDKAGRDFAANSNDQTGSQHAKGFSVPACHADQINHPADAAAQGDAAQRLCAAYPKQQGEPEGPDYAHGGLDNFCLQPYTPPASRMSHTPCQQHQRKAQCYRDGF